MYDHRQDSTRSSNKQAMNNRRDLLTNVYTKNQRALRERILRRNNKSANRNHNAQQFKGLTLEDYVRGRSSSEKLKTQSTKKESSVIRLRKEEGQLLFANNYEIKEQDEENYTQKKEVPNEVRLPQIKRGRAVLQTEKSVGKDQNKSHAVRMKTSLNALQELRGIYKGYSLRKSGSRTKNPGRESVFEMETPYDHKTKLKTMSQFYRGKSQKQQSDSPVRHDVKYSTKYGWDIPRQQKNQKRHSMLHYL